MQNKLQNLLLCVLILCGISTPLSYAQTSTSSTIQVYANTQGSQARLLTSDSDNGTSPNDSFNLASPAFLEGAAQAYIPFSIPSTTFAAIQSAATVQFQVSVSAGSSTPPSFSLYGYPSRGTALSPAAGDYSGGILLTTVSLPVGSTSGQLTIDVTKFAIQQVDGSNVALSFRLQANPQTNSLARLVPSASVANRSSGVTTSAPQLVITHTFADTTTIIKKVLAGYQGWFRTPQDGMGNTGWAHWFNGSPSAANEAFDSWPDMSEYTTAEKATVPGFTFPDGTPATLYSGQNARTVLRHFQWMENEGIDGIMLSQFGNYLPGAGSESNNYPMLQAIMGNVRAAATATGRTWAVEYDGSGMNPATMYNTITTQWRYMVDNGYTRDPQYLHQGGLPVIEIYGFFPPSVTGNQPMGNPTYGNPIIDFFQTPGPYQAVLIGSGAQNYAVAQPTGSSPNPAYISMLLRLYAYIPWNVGHYHFDSTTGNATATVSGWPGDNAFFSSNGVKFIPLVYPGTNPAGAPTNPPLVPRRNGSFLWEQFAQISAIPGLNTVYVAMFDEVNEGTQIMPITATPPAQTSPFYTYGTYPVDWYEQLVVQGETMLKNGTPITATIPIQP